MKVKYTGPKARASVPLPIGTRRLTKEYIFFGPGEVKELPEDQAKALVALSPYYALETPVAPVEAVSETVPEKVEAVTVSTPGLIGLSVPKKRGRSKKVK